MRFLEVFIDSSILWIAAYFVGKILFEDTKKQNLLRIILINIFFSLLLATLNIINSEVLKGIIKIVCVYGLQCLFYKTTFKRSISKTMVVSLIWYLCLFVSEVIVVLITSAIVEVVGFTMFALKNNIVMNILIAISNLLLVKLISNKLVPFVKNSTYNIKSSLIVIITILIALALLVFKIPLNEWKFNAEFVITMIILLCFCIVGLYLLKQRADINKTTTMYQQVVEYSDITNGLLEDYRVVSHEHKNQLSIIRGMLNDENKELVDYVESLLEKRDVIKYQWISELNHLPLSGLKGLINYKLIEMETYKINMSISISKELSKIKLNKLSTKQKDNLYSIIGVYLDNAIQASKKSKKKEISLEMYKEKKDVVIILANTYTGKIELDKIDHYGYTTKGKNHGVGLHIVKRILEEDKTFMQNRSLFEDYYVQELRIHLDEIKSK